MATSFLCSSIVWPVDSQLGRWLNDTARDKLSLNVGQMHGDRNDTKSMGHRHWEANKRAWRKDCLSTEKKRILACDHKRYRETAMAHTVFMPSSMRHVSWVVLARSRGGPSRAPDRDCSIAVEAVEGSQWARDRGRGALLVEPLHLQRRAGLEQRIASRHAPRCSRCSTCSRGEPRSYRPYRGHTTIHVL